MSQSDDFLSFEKALRELQMRSEELKKLVSEGEIRAYRDGDSMKFRAEDIQSLSSHNEGETKLSFADSLEDDTGMVTEEISDEDTLLAEDDIVEDASPRVQRAARGPARAARPARAMSSEAAEPTPTWVTALAGVGLAVMVWALFIAIAVGAESSPEDSFFTQMWAARK